MTFPLTYGLSKTGLPLIVVKLYGLDVCLMLDTGSNKNIIDHRVYQHFKDKLEVQPEPSEVFTLNGVSTTVTIDIPFAFENHDYYEPFLCTEMINAFDRINDESGIQIHGILGNQFFLKYGWILDFEKIEVSMN